MSLLPGWDSTDSTAAIAHYLHIAAIVVLGLLVVAESLALIYDSRNHSLVGVAERNREAAQKANDDAAEARRVAEVKSLGERLAEANEQVRKLEETATPRRLTPSQIEVITRAIQPFSGQKIVVWYLVTSPDGKELAADFASALKVATSRTTVDMGFWIFGADPVGVNVRVPPGTSSTPPAAQALAAALVEVGLAISPNIESKPGIEPDSIQLEIGLKPAAKSRK